MTKAAKANLAAVNYHFGDKETLHRAVILRRLRSMNSLRLSQLDEECSQCGTAPPSLEKIIRIMAQPLFDLYRSPETGGRAFVQILSRGLVESPGITSQLLSEEYHPKLARFSQLIRRHALHLTPDEFLWRFGFIIGAMHHTLANLHQMNALTRGICRNDDNEGALARFIAHSVASFRAPSTVNRSVNC